MKKLNIFMVVQWIIFFPLILPLSIITGAIRGVKRAFHQAYADIFDQEIDAIYHDLDKI